MASIQKDSEDTSSEYVLPELNDIINLSKDDILYSDELYDEIFHLGSESEKQDYLNKLEEAAKTKDCLTKYKAKIKAVKSDYNKKLKGPAELQPASDYLPDGIFKDQNIDLDGWIVKDDGIFRLEGDKTIQACFHPIFPIMRKVDCFDEKKQKVEIIWRRPGHRWQKATVDREDISSAKNIVKLSSYGIGVTSENAKGLVRFLSTFENKNYDLLGEIKTTSKMGWNNGFFVPYEQNADDVIVYDESQRSAYEALKPKGSFDLWLKAIRDVRKTERFEVLVYLAASFASVLVDKIDGLSFVLNLYGKSGQGKTVALMMACSVWANPNDAEYIVGSNATESGLEFKLSFINHLPFMMDDLTSLQLDKATKTLSVFVYKLCAVGKLRGTKELTNAETRSWKLITLTNAERPLIGEDSAGGSVNRVVDIPIGDTKLFENARAFVSVLKKNYGHAGRAFINALRSMEDNELIQIYEQKRTQLLELAADSGNEKEDKQIQAMALILTADQIATDHIFNDGIYIDASKCLPVLKGINDVSEEARAYDALMGIIAGNQNRFVSDPGEPPISTPVWGRFEKDKIIMNNTYFCEEITRLGFNPQQLFRWLVKNKNGEKDSKGYPPRCTITKNDTRPRSVIFSTLEKGVDDFEPADGDLPF